MAGNATVRSAETGSFLARHPWAGVRWDLLFHIPLSERPILHELGESPGGPIGVLFGHRE
jgi:hypothetical protein